ncbi:hypothetical protein U1Q18_011655 [Sarracenia purpurea var. burkii]
MDSDHSTSPPPLARSQVHICEGPLRGQVLHSQIFSPRVGGRSSPLAAVKGSFSSSKCGFFFPAGFLDLNLKEDYSLLKSIIPSNVQHRRCTGSCGISLLRRIFRLSD